MISLITCTGGRPDAFRLLERWIGNQTYTGRLQWIVVDDCDPETQTTMGQDVLRPEPRWSPDDNHTLARNMLAALDAVRGEYVVIAEDDEYYAPHYLTTMLAELQTWPFCGQGYTRYYHVARRAYQLCTNDLHSSLASMGWRASHVPALCHLFSSRPGPYYDLEWWRRYQSRGALIFGALLHVGIKGMPGRSGISKAHTEDDRCTALDPDMAVLREWIGDDANAYAPFYDGADDGGL